MKQHELGSWFNTHPGTKPAKQASFQLIITVWLYNSFKVLYNEDIL